MATWSSNNLISLQGRRTDHWLELDTLTVFREQDPISWHCAQSNWESQEADGENFLSFDNGSAYYHASAIESLVEQA